MADDTNPVTTTTEQPARDATGTLLNQASTAPTTTDSSSTTQETKLETKPETKLSTEPDPTKTAINQTTKPEQTGAPEKYSDFKLPEGLKLEPKAIEEASAVFKGLNLSQDAAQSLVDFHAKQLQAAIDGPFKTVVNLKSAWEGELDSTYGDDIKAGGKVNLAIARMIDTLPKDIANNFRESLNMTLVGSNPGFVAGMKLLSERFKEGTTVKGNGPSPGGQAAPDAKPKSIASALYPHLKSAQDQQ